MNPSVNKWEWNGVSVLFLIKFTRYLTCIFAMVNGIVVWGYFYWFVEIGIVVGKNGGMLKFGICAVLNICRLVTPKISMAVVLIKYIAVSDLHFQVVHR